MKICLKCGGRFKRKMIAGKYRNTQHRKFCWICSPFGAGNNRNLARMDKKCPGPCGRTLAIEDFLPRKGATKFYTYCRDCTAEYNRQRTIERKRQCVEYKGGKCVRCGYDRYLGALDFHHVEPDHKDLNIAHSHKTFEQLKEELDKCILVCSNCHREIHAELRGHLTTEELTSGIANTQAA